MLAVRGIKKHRHSAYSYASHSLHSKSHIQLMKDSGIHAGAVMGAKDLGAEEGDLFCPGLCSSESS